MRTVFFDFVTHYGGAQRVVVELASNLRDHVELEILDAYGACAPFRAAVIEAGLPCQTLEAGARRIAVGHRGHRVRRALACALSAPGLLDISRRLRRSLRLHPPDLIWTTSVKALAVLALAQSGRRAPVVFHLQGRPPGGFGIADQYLLRSRVQAFMVVSEALRQDLAELGIPPERVRLVPNSVDVERLRLRAQLAPLAPFPEGGGLRILLPGTLVPAKGHACAIRALARIAACGVDAVLWLAGDEPPGQPSDYSRHLRSLAHQGGISERVFFLGWREDMPQLMAASSIVVLPSRSEGLPRSLLEAMALERPVVATPVGGVTELIEHGCTGWLFDVDDDTGLANSVMASLDERRREVVVSAALNRVQQRYGPERQTCAALDVFRSALIGKIFTGRSRHQPRRPGGGHDDRAAE